MGRFKARCFKDGSFARFMADELIAMIPIVILVIGSLVAFVIIGHYTKASGYVAPPKDSIENSTPKHYLTEMLLGFFVVMSVVTIGVLILGLFFGVPYLIISEWYESYTRQENDMLSTIESHNSDLFPKGSKRKFVAIVISKSLLFFVFVWLSSYPIHFIGVYVCHNDPVSRARHNRALAEGGTHLTIENIAHYAIGLGIIFFALVFLGMFYAIALFGLQGVQEKWEAYREDYIRKRR
jgi:hypothetical protein